MFANTKFDCLLVVDFVLEVSNGIFVTLLKLLYVLNFRSACYAMTDRGYADEECDIQMANSVGKMNAENASSQQGKSIAEVQEVSTPPCIAPSPSAYPSFSHLAYPVCFPYCIHDRKTRNVVSFLREALNSSSNAPLMTSPRPRMP